eukprot:jgi/Ulvmu1/4744/UM020_0028.1
MAGNMDQAQLQAAIEEKGLQITTQGGAVRELKDRVKAKKKAKEDTAEADADVLAGVDKLKALKAELEELEVQLENVTGIPRDKGAFREAVAKALEGRMFYTPSFSIYGGVSGLYDYGPPGTAVKANLTQFWRQHFVFAESMLELECPSVTPEIVLKTSGHVDRFVDYSVQDDLGNCIRADTLLKDFLEALMEDPKATADNKKKAEHDLAEVEGMDCEALRSALRKWDVQSNEPGGGKISDPFPFNLMFQTSIGPSGTQVGYLRPETAQGIFVNFRDLLYYNGGRLPFAAAQIGQSFRNEINPKQGLLRVREFTQAEIEHFVHPERKTHPRFKDIADVAPLMHSAKLQQAHAKPEALPLREAVAQGVVANETLAYFIGRTYLFMVAAGINPKRMIFRQHLPNEMAHYACDCWDCEVQTTYGWVECAGLADRSAFDLGVHSKASKTDLVAYEQFDAPKEEEVVEVEPQMKVMGKTLKQAAKAVVEHLAGLSEADALALKGRLEADGKATVEVDGSSHSLTADMVSIEKKTKKVHGRNYTPSVIEPSFGIGRVLYCIFEHTFYTRPDDAQKTVFKFAPMIAPIKVTVFPLMQNEELNDVAKAISLDLRRAGVSSLIDTTGVTIGKRYARTDELGVPFAVTVDYATTRQGEQKDTVTLRERDTRQQVRVPVAKVVDIVSKLCQPAGEGLPWEVLKADYPLQAESTDD